MWKRSTLAWLALLALLVSACGSAEPKEERDDRPYGSQIAVVERIVDADTVVLDVKEPGDVLGSGPGQEIQLREMDAPEAPSAGLPPECWGAEAARFAEGVLPTGSTVYVMPEGQPGADGKITAYVWLESGVLYNELAVREGQARAVPQIFVERLRVAETEAKTANRGMWGPPCDYDATPPPPGVPAPAAPKA
ncbi:MAG: thermonuclease family protein [Nitriliruptorales bacterium]